MKNRIHRFLVIMLSAIFFLMLQITATAETAVTIRGADSVRAGDTIEIGIYISGTSVSAFEGTVTYNPSVLIYQSSKSVLAGWDISLDAVSGTVKLLGIDNTLENPVKSEKRMIVLIFKASEQIIAGAKVAVTGSAFSVYDNGSEIASPVSSYMIQSSAPRSGDASLANLGIEGGMLSPEFSSDVNEYSASVPYSVATLSVLATKSHPGAGITISSTELHVGENRITVLVTAENGAQKSYILNITRQQDPDYVPSDDATLSGITLSAGILSPAFSPEITEYAVYLPYEIDKLQVNGTAASSTAQKVIGAGENLQIGLTHLSVTCIAESGKELTYTIHIVRMAEYTGGIPRLPAANETLPGQETDNVSESAALQTGISEEIVTGSGVGSPDDMASETIKNESTAVFADFFTDHLFLFVVIAVILISAVAFCIVFLIRKRNKADYRPRHGA